MLCKGDLHPGQEDNSGESQDLDRLLEEVKRDKTDRIYFAFYCSLEVNIPLCLIVCINTTRKLFLPLKILENYHLIYRKKTNYSRNPAGKQHGSEAGPPLIVTIPQTAQDRFLMGLSFRFVTFKASAL